MTRDDNSLEKPLRPTHSLPHRSPTPVKPSQKVSVLTVPLLPAEQEREHPVGLVRVVVGERD